MSRAVSQDTIVFWTHDREQRLLLLAFEGHDSIELAKLMSEPDRPVTAKAVRARLSLLGARVRAQRPDSMWTPERDAALRDLWGRVPRLKLAEIAYQIGENASEAQVSRRATFLGLPSRWASVEMRVAHAKVHAPEKVPVRRRVQDRRGEFVAPMTEAIRASGGGVKLHAALTTTAPRVKHQPLETPCPFIEATGKQCCAPVDRRPDRNGVKPSQYCPTHRGRVLPISRGAIGTLATYQRGHRFG